MALAFNPRYIGYSRGLTSRLRLFHYSSTRMTESKTKSESEWRAILTPEQVRSTSVVVWGVDVNLGWTVQGSTSERDRICRDW